ncbi:MAG: VWA domain-containing protein [Betaproteobacteria bacterium]|nr:VWA domain-containing protein [Betaproteobacteria bacterium]
MTALASNVVRFARGLRRAGLPVGTGHVQDALRATELVDVARREDFYWALASVLIDRHAHLELYDAAFRYFWEQQPLARAASTSAPSPGADKGEPLAQRVAQAFSAMPATDDDEASNERPPADASFTASRQEQLSRMDFQSMSVEDMREARRLLATLRLPVAPVRTRRWQPDVHGRQVDLRATLRASLRGQSEWIPLKQRRPRLRHPPLVALCDISGSMHRYAQMMLRFLHAMTNDRDRVHVFLFGTRLTNVTRQLRHRDIDTALAAVAGGVLDWGGGTRIGAALNEFNLRWSRRVLGQNAVVLLISDGLERDRIDQLSQAMQQLHRACTRLIWLNPLLRYDGFEPLAQGVRAMLPHVDDFRAAHNLNSLLDLARVLGPNNNS